VIAIVSREKALAGIQKVLRDINASDDVLQLAQRNQALIPRPPPGGDRIVTSRDGNPFV
jgi:hypothetical protein